MITKDEYLKADLKTLDGDIKNNWYIACLEKEIPHGKPITRTIYDIPYVIYRNDEGSVRVHIDQCLHRGAPLSKGKCEKDGIRCPYHGWRYDKDGKVCEIPSEGEATKPRSWQLKVIPTKVQDGCVWIWTGEDLPYNDGPPWRFPFHDDPKWTNYFMITDFDNEVTHLVQNFMDVPHTVYVHDKWFRKKRSIEVKVDIDVNDGHVKVTYHQPNDTIGFMTAILNPSKKPMIHTDEFIFPNITRVDYTFGERGFIINSQCTPVTRFKTRVYTWICYDIGILSKPTLPFFKFYTRKVITQDTEIMEQHGSVLKVLGENQYHSSGADELHLAIQKMRELGAQDKTKPYQMKFNHQREFWI